MKHTTSPIECSFTDYLKQHAPEKEDISSLDPEELIELRRKYIDQLLQEDHGELDEVAKLVAKSINNRRLVSNVKAGPGDQDSSLGERLADKVASFGGSWRFIIIFFAMLIGWMILNVWWLSNKGFDPYPFILLNLILSCLASIQAPIIMMSQNRQEDKDRERAEHDYKVNLKAEVEIRMLHEKLDHLLLHQNKRLLEIQKVQMQMLEGIEKKINTKIQ
ncbi:DUF1003 domain-containing protein [Terrimonas sp. NA20]|uniref:DUF1003 domain-containing protein n=1 Tax=Terrimonas ginsenosidimutans TaxID=2908004 RepID=A0ABS9KNF1_9BACT|nr:DUF1003 domain-containing protein [Terrimonas ginsenosidimutans]MCG2613849.1 DUF1003 domain-containing protein [Terrimonas ginsenosidimutans]